jgi:secreted trypsin-like serine protease
MRVYKVTATGLVHTGLISVEGVSLVPAAADATIVLSDSLDGLSNNVGGAKCETEYSTETCLYGQSFKTGLYVTLTGAGAVAYIYYK